MTESPDSAADTTSTDAEDPTGSDGPAAAVAKPGRPADDEPKIPRRERVLRLALITVGAALVASIFTVYSGAHDGDPDAGAEATAEAGSGTVTVDIDVSTDDSDQNTQIVTRYLGDDFDSTLRVGGDSSAYSTETAEQQLVVVDGQYRYRQGDDELVDVADGSVVVLDTELALPARSLGWSTDGLAAFVAALDLAADNTVVNDVLKASITMADARALGELPLALEVLTDEAWAWTDDQVIDVEVDLDGGMLRRMTASAADERPDRPGGLLSISTSTTYTDLGADTAVSVVAE